MCRLNKLGIRFTSERQQALLGGDTSGTIIHPFFIPAAEALGIYFCKGTASSPAVVRLHAKHVKISREWLAKIFKGCDWELRAQVALWVTSSAVTLALNDHYTLLYMQRGCEAVNTAGLRFIPAHGRPPVFSEELHEKLSVLSQIIYLENFLSLALGGGEPTMTARIEKEFRHQLPVRHTPLSPSISRPNHALIEDLPATIQDLSVDHAYENHSVGQGYSGFTCPPSSLRQVLLLPSTIPPTTDRGSSLPGARMGIWRQLRDQLVTQLGDYSQDLLSNLLRFQGLGHKSGAEVIRGCCIDCFAHLAVLCESLREVEPASQVVGETLCDSSLEQLGELAQDMRKAEYTRHDLLLRVGAIR